MFLCSLLSTLGGVLNAILCLGCIDSKVNYLVKFVSATEKCALIESTIFHIVKSERIVAEGDLVAETSTN